MMNIWNWVSNRKRLRKENEFLRERIKALEKKEREMQILNVNLKREGDSATAVLNQKHAKVVNVKERHIEQLLEHEQRLKKELEEKKQTAAGYYNKLLAAHKEIKELHRRIAQMEAENRRKN